MRRFPSFVDSSPFEAGTRLRAMIIFFLRFLMFGKHSHVLKRRFTKLPFSMTSSPCQSVQRFVFFFVLSGHLIQQ